MQSWRPKDTPTESQSFFKANPDEIRALVLDYLCHNAFSNAARAFVRDSAVKHLDADGDELMCASDKEEPRVDTLALTLEERLLLAQRRKDVCIHILSGQVDEATTLLSSYFPTVLSEDHDILAESSESSQLAHTPSYIPATSVDPTHLALNLRIQAFIEASRTVPLTYHSPDASFTLGPPSPIRRAESSCRPANEDISAHQEALIHRAQSLYAEAHCLAKPVDRAHYMKELGDIGGLLVYTEPENSPMAKYLLQERRESLADQIDSAILFRMHRLPISKIELVARYTSTVCSFARGMGVGLPPPGRRPAGLHLPPSWQEAQVVPKRLDSSNSGSSAKKGTSGGKESSEQSFPLFDLTEYVDS
ncbi:unnamed protein product [Somion occarium]|uniref:CRA domain-containing protein n=1 Tax=Somion occarium TaxID=3059160 RepID=A0ABP1D9V4_9APHY